LARFCRNDPCAPRLYLQAEGSGTSAIQDLRSREETGFVRGRGSFLCSSGQPCPLACLDAAAASFRTARETTTLPRCAGLFRCFGRVGYFCLVRGEKKSLLPCPTRRKAVPRVPRHAGPAILLGGAFSWSVAPLYDASFEYRVLGTRMFVGHAGRDGSARAMSWGGIALGPCVEP
jgi:hypothetical protein